MNLSCEYLENPNPDPENGSTNAACRLEHCRQEVSYSYVILENRIFDRCRFEDCGFHEDGDKTIFHSFTKEDLQYGTQVAHQKLDELHQR